MRRFPTKTEMAMWLSRQLMVVCLLFIIAQAVDQNNFKKCDQSGFCKQHRALEPGQSQYSVLMDTIYIQPTKVTLTLLNNRNGVKLLLELVALEDSTARLRISELEPIRPRFEPAIGDVLAAEPKQQKLSVQQQDASGATLAFQDNKVIIQADPFRVDFVVDNEPVISVNARALLRFEHFRQRPAAEEKEEEDPPQEEQQGEGEQGEEDESKEKEKSAPKKETTDEDDGIWEETFKSHTDTKPFGPSSIGMDISFPNCEHVYGIPEHADPLALKTTTNGEPYRLYNLDVFEYDLNNPMALYASVPVMLAHNEKRTVGVFWLNAAETWVDIGSNVADKGMFSKMVEFIKRNDREIPQIDTHWMSESGVIDLFLMLGPTANDVFRQNGKLVGNTPLPPLFALAYHQSRWNYNDEQDVANVDAGFDQHNIPMDVIWLDIEHSDGKRYFTWDRVKFPHPEQMIDAVSAKGRKMVTIVDPHIKRDDNYHIHKEASAKDYYVKNKDGNPYEGWCWPGSSGWLDFFNPEIQRYWASKFALDNYEGSTLDLFTWNDMNEPSVFNGPEITMHKDCQHFGGWEHRDVHNIYGLLQHKSTVQGQRMRQTNNDRTFVLSRAAFAGTQKFGAVWTGDNTGEWGHLKISLPMIMSLSVTGITFSGADVGGFFKNPDTELLTRWYQAAAYQPFFRAHAHLDTRRREPWLQPEEHLNAIREALQARYALLPYWYTLFYNGEKHGTPAMKPMWVDFPTERVLFDMDDQHLVGSALLVKPVTDAGATGVNVYFPGSDQQWWFDVDTYAAYQGGKTAYIPVNLNKIPVFQRGGYIVPRKQRIRRSSSLTTHDPYTLIVTLNNQGKSSGDLYVDDFHTFLYREGKFAHKQLTFENNQLTSKNMEPNWDPSSFSTDAWLERVVVVGLGKKPSSIHIDGPDIEKSELGFQYNSANKVVTIRKPGINITKDFTITIQ